MTAERLVGEEGSDFIVEGERSPAPVNSGYPGPGANNSGGALGIDFAEDILALWSDGQALRANADIHETSQNRQGFNPIADPEPIPGNANGTRTRPSVASDDQNRHIAVFEEKRGDEETVQAAIRGSNAGGPTVFGPPVELAGPPDSVLEHDQGNKKNTGPKVAVNSGGEAVAVWARFDGESGNVVQASLLTPRDDPEIPPRPRPGPAPGPRSSTRSR